MKLLPAMAVLLWLGCVEAPALPFDRKAQLEGEVSVPQGEAGDAWVFLYAPGEGPPGAPAVPRYASAVSRGRLASGDRHFVLAGVAPNPYRLWGFLDVNGNFDPTIAVLAQPGAGDRVATGSALNLQPGRTARADLTVAQKLELEPPACELEGGLRDARLDATGTGVVSITLVPNAMGGRFDPKRQGFRVGLVDADGNGQPDDADGDGVPDLSLQAFLRWLPREGQAGSAQTVIVPLVLNPAPFLSALGGRIDVELTVDRVQLYVLPQAQQLDPADGGLTALGSPPVGDYELVLLSAGGGFWLLPNGLSGEVASQGVRLHFERTGG